MGRIATPVGRLAVEVTGQGPPAVLWHSFFVDSQTWRRVVPDLSRERTLVIIDGPGFGASDPFQHLLTLADCASAAMAVLRHLGLTSADWLGNAWGGHVGIVAAARYPAMVRSLVSIGAPVHALGAHGGTERIQINLARPLVRVLGFPRPLAGMVLKGLLNDRTRRDDPEAVQIVLNGMRRPGRRSFDLALHSMTLGRPDLTAEALSLEMPVLFAAGDDRGEWTPDEAAAITSRMARASTTTLHGVRGIAPLEDPAAVIDLVRTFWRTGSTESISNRPA
jgi:pimeloyl-ACP methyl ester carboxylesterase